MIEQENIRVCTFNVNSIIDVQNRNRLFGWLRQQPIDIIGLQEIGHSRNRDIPVTQWRAQWNRDPSKACFSKHCAILINNPNLKIKDIAKLLDGRILKDDIYLDNNPGQILRVVNIYAPANNNNDNSLRAFCNSFPVVELAHPHLVMMGDLNCITDAYTDRFPPFNENRNLTDVAPWHLWDPIIRRLDLIDTAMREENGDDDETQDLWFTSIHHRGNETTMTRIDYIFVSSTMVNRVSNQRVQSCEARKSDHRMVLATLNTRVIPRSKALASVDTRILADEEYQSQIRNALTNLQRRRVHDARLADHSIFWDKCKAVFLQISLSYAKKKRLANMKTRRELNSRLQQVDRHIELHPLDETAIKERADIMEQSLAYESHRLERVATMAKVKWLEEGERASPFFTQKLISSQKKKIIEALRDSSGVRSDDHVVMAETARAFYETLYTSEPTDRIAQEFLLSEIRTLVSGVDRTSLDSDIKAGELHAAIKSMANRSSPGSDGLPYEFYKRFRLELVPVLLEVFNQVSHTSQGVLPSTHRHSLTTILYKKGDAEDPKNYRPISLTQCDYKILTKVLTNRINPVANKLIGSWQTGFIPGRQGHDNVLLLDLVADHFHEGLAGDAAILSLDQEKAYDRVNWEYLHKVLERFGFGERMRYWILQCYTGLNASVIVNSTRSQRYNIGRGLRQGDPLAPILFNFVLEPFLLYYHRYATGCDLGATRFKVAAFADDTNLGMSPGDEAIVRRAILLHECASGAKVNVTKTEFIPLSPGADAVFDMPDYGRRAFGEPFVHLGVVIQVGGRDMEIIERDLKNKLWKNAGLMRTRRLSFTGKVTVLNTYLLSQLWYVAPFYSFSNEFFHEVDKLCKFILWGGKAKVSLNWFRRPRKEGGWGLINVQSQVQSLKAKWLTRWQKENPSWKEVITDIATRIYDKRSRGEARSFLETVRGRQWAIDDMEQAGAAILVPMVKAYASLDPVRAPPTQNPPGPPGSNILVAGGDATVAIITVKQTRRYLDKKNHERHAARPKAQAKCRQAPIFENIGLKQRVSPIIQDPRRECLPNDQWKVVFRRMHTNQRRTNEKDFLYLLAHHCIWTNVIKNRAYKEIDPRCRRCKPPIPCYEVESRPHAFHECPTVKEAWNRMRSWVTILFPEITLSDKYTQVVTCWPEETSLPSIIVHLHSVVTNCIWRTYCQLGDGQKLEKDELRWMVVHSFKHRGKIELSRARYKDQLEKEKVMEGGEESLRGDDWHALLTIAEWHHPPHIMMTKDGVEFGELWET